MRVSTIFATSLYGFLLMLAAVPLFICRIRIEEKMLLEEFGEEYEKYREDTWALVPYIW
jgi:protein-S-isoprenylcysteine O-methyltransferase Ste14